MPTESSPPGPALRAFYDEVRATTLYLAAPLSAEDMSVQAAPECSPTKWHLAHTTWFFETFVLASAQADHRPFHPRFGYLFNSYYNAFGARVPRPHRHLLSRPALDEVLRYRAHVDRHMRELLGEASPAVVETTTLGLHHEQQHQELILTDIKRAFGGNPLRPAYRGRAGDVGTLSPAPRWVDCPGGLHTIGHAGAGFAYDNEGSAHQVFLRPYRLASRPVTCGDWMAFRADGGYDRPELWLSDGWDTARAGGWLAPLYWEQHDGEPSHLTLNGLQPVAAAEPVTHISFYEADAYARWAGARLPTEAEWEAAAARVPAGGSFLDAGRLHPAPVAGRAGLVREGETWEGEAPAEPWEGEAPAEPDGMALERQARPRGVIAPARQEPRPPGPRPPKPGSGALTHLFGEVWQWTASPYVAYPGYRPPAGAPGEYNGKFMCNQMVLRGGSCATPRSHFRLTYRNFFPPDARWQFTGLRLAEDA